VALTVANEDIVALVPANDVTIAEDAANQVALTPANVGVASGPSFREASWEMVRCNLFQSPGEVFGIRDMLALLNKV
jgi:hypothetical protein